MIEILEWPCYDRMGWPYTLFIVCQGDTVLGRFRSRERAEELAAGREAEAQQ